VLVGVGEGVEVAVGVWVGQGTKPSQTAQSPPELVKTTPDPE
jgi:hypothetical protein